MCVCIPSDCRPTFNGRGGGGGRVLGVGLGLIVNVAAAATEFKLAEVSVG